VPADATPRQPQPTAAIPVHRRLGHYRATGQAPFRAPFRVAFRVSFRDTLPPPLAGESIGRCQAVGIVNALAA
jgi:hypothetical protein